MPVQAIGFHTIDVERRKILISCEILYKFLFFMYESK